MYNNVIIAVDIVCADVLNGIFINVIDCNIAESNNCFEFNNAIFVESDFNSLLIILFVSNNKVWI